MFRLCLIFFISLFTTLEPSIAQSRLTSQEIIRTLRCDDRVKNLATEFGRMPRNLTSTMKLVNGILRAGVAYNLQNRDEFHEARVLAAKLSVELQKSLKQRGVDFVILERLSGPLDVPDIRIVPSTMSALNRMALYVQEQTGGEVHAPSFDYMKGEYFASVYTPRSIWILSGQRQLAYRLALQDFEGLEFPDLRPTLFHESSHILVVRAFLQNRGFALHGEAFAERSTMLPGARSSDDSFYTTYMSFDEPLSWIIHIRELLRQYVEDPPFSILKKDKLRRILDEIALARILARRLEVISDSFRSGLQQDELRSYSLIRGSNQHVLGNLRIEGSAPYDIYWPTYRGSDSSIDDHDLSSVESSRALTHGSLDMVSYLDRAERIIRPFYYSEPSPDFVKAKLQEILAWDPLPSDSGAFTP